MTDERDGRAGTDPERATDHWDHVSFVIRSQYRLDVLERLSQGPATPSRIATHTEYSVSHVSRALKQLRGRGLVDLLVSEQQNVGRLYGLTTRAERVWQTIESEGLN